MKWAKALAQKEGILTGVSGGVDASPSRMQIAEKAAPGSVILCMLPDTGERYLSTPLFEVDPRGHERGGTGAVAIDAGLSAGVGPEGPVRPCQPRPACKTCEANARLAKQHGRGCDAVHHGHVQPRRQVPGQPRHAGAAQHHGLAALVAQRNPRLPGNGIRRGIHGVLDGKHRNAAGVNAGARLRNAIGVKVLLQTGTETASVVTTQKRSATSIAQ